jgi:hypothetical protein
VSAVEDPWASPRAAPTQRPGSPLRALVAGALLVTAALQFMFAALSCMGVGLGAAAAAGALPDRELQEFSWVLIVAYGIMGPLAAVPIFAQIPAAVALIRGRHPTALLWIACAACALPLGTVYCSLTAIPAGILLLVYLLIPQPEDPRGT